MNNPFTNPVAASRAVLIEALGVLGAFRSSLVLIGGWVPELRLPGKGHPGSIDVDLAVDTRTLPPGPYATLCHCLTTAGYQRGSAPNVFLREIEGTSTRIPVKLDLVGGQYAGSREAQFSQRAQELHIAALRGIDIALDSCDEIRIDGERPDRVLDSVVARTATLESFVCMKAFALAERQKKKDAYDIYFCLRHGDLDAMSAALSSMKENGLVREAINHLADKFRTIDYAGPVDAAQVAEENGEDFEQARRAAFELMRLLLERVGTSV
ncbi:MAG TPA: nucleotidyl transferase AbiEii/AbiGii toxin family protein [Pirellulales bacterium]|nr:nucleotidyl transferase AbiEii/AbiGii toxin family protein [Pirellulales bacterium]